MHENEALRGAVENIIIDEAAAGQRLDNFLIRLLKGVPRSRIYRVVRKGEVRVNKRRARPEQRLDSGDRVRIPPLRRARSVPAPAAENVSWLPGRILYEDDSMLVLDKPSGYCVHGGSGYSHGLVELMRSLRAPMPYLELVHRLDKETSGCLMFAKQRPALLALQSQLRQGGIGKCYLALVRGRWEGGPRDIRISLQRYSNARAGHRVVGSDQGRWAHSRITPRQVFTGCSLVQVQIFTGRMHQARAHCALSGYPIAGDRRYGEPVFNRDMRPAGLKRLFLHAESLSLPHPLNGKPLQLQAPLPVDLATVLAWLDGSP